MGQPGKVASPARGQLNRKNGNCIALQLSSLQKLDLSSFSSVYLISLVAVSDGVRLLL